MLFALKQHANFVPPFGLRPVQFDGTGVTNCPLGIAFLRVALAATGQNAHQMDNLPGSPLSSADSNSEKALGRSFQSYGYTDIIIQFRLHVARFYNRFCCGESKPRERLP